MSNTTTPNAAVAMQTANDPLDALARESARLGRDALDGSGTKHTPGPWRLVPIADINGETMAVEAERATLVTYGLPRVHAAPELMANARLIAAAPSLYDFVRKLAGAGNEEAKSMLASLYIVN